MKITYDNNDRTIYLELTEEIDHHEAEKIKQRTDYEIQDKLPKKLIVDFKNVNFMDSAGIGLIIGRYKMIKMHGGDIYMVNVKKNVAKIFEMSGVLKIIPIIEGGY